VIVALAGGVGGARLAAGLAKLLPPAELTIVVNTGDDFEHLGLAISPDLDTVMYTLAGVHNPATGWGQRDETWHFMEALEKLGGDTWFRLGDRDLAVHVQRTQSLSRGETLSATTAMLSHRFGVKHSIVPMSDTPVRTFIATDEGELAFQHYFVRRRCEPAIQGFRFAGSETARAPASMQRLCQGAGVDAVIVCPSNPYVSIGPILAVKEIRNWLERRTFPVVAISPIVGGQAIKGPAAKMMRELGVEPTPTELAKHYGDLVDGWVIDVQDAHDQPTIAGLGKTVAVTDTIMADEAKTIGLANAVLALARSLKNTGARRTLPNQSGN
jgi:LPPG:FO 2-phospho-L-lactate transferase